MSSLKILKKTFLFYLPLLLLVYLLVYSCLYYISVNQMIEFASSKAPREILESRKRKNYSAEEFGLIKEKASLNSQLKMAESDSIGLALNLGDSVVQLEMKGIALKQVKFSAFRYDRFFKAIHPAAYEEIFSNPFIIQRIEGASEKEPITYKKAPKDTIEAATQPGPEMIDSSKIEFIEWHMLLNNGIMVSVVQSDSEAGKWNRENRNYRLRRYLAVLKVNTINVLRLKKFEYHPEITIYIPSGEARSFYRALPENGDVRLKL